MASVVRFTLLARGGTTVNVDLPNCGIPPVGERLFLEGLPALAHYPPEDVGRFVVTSVTWAYDEGAGAVIPEVTAHHYASNSDARLMLDLGGSLEPWYQAPDRGASQ